jgi:hypothetical protein
MFSNSTRIARNVTGAPWTEVSALAIVATAPIWPFPFEGDACESESGLSVWNSTLIPTWSGSLSSGISPFWSIWFTNESDYLLSADSVGLTLHLVGPISPDSACGQALAPTLVHASAIDPPVDSTVAGPIAWNYIGAGFASSHAELVEYFEMGAQQLGDLDGSATGWAVTYETCGLPGYAGNTQFAQDVPTGVYTTVTNDSTPSWYVTESDTCSSTSYNLTFSPPTNLTHVGGWASIDLPFSVATDGLLAWMTALDLTNAATGLQQQSSDLSCDSSPTNNSDCRPTGGWFGVLESSSGYWLDVYGNIGGRSGWLYSNTPFDTNNSLLVFSSETSNFSELTLAMQSETAAVVVNGSTTT